MKETVKLDREFFRKIQPVGNVKFGERHVLLGSGYQACIHIYAFPVYAYSFWCEDFTYDNTICTMDISNYDSDSARKHIEKAMAEDGYNFNNSHSHTDAADAGSSYAALEELYNEISTAGEILKLIHIRIYVGGKTFQDLENNTSHIITDLESRGYRVGVYLNEAEYEYKSLYLSSAQQLRLPNKLEGHPIPAGSLAGGYPYNYVSKSDPLGMYLGYVPAGGTVIFDPCHNDVITGSAARYRLCYDMMIAGKKGSGKSTLLKKLLLSRAILGDNIRGIAVSNEFDNLTAVLGGTMIPMDGSCGVLNLLEIQPTSDDNNVNFTAHLSKLNMIYRYLSPEADSAERNEFEKLCRELYISFGIFSVSGNVICTGRKSTDYPIFSDLLELVKTQLYSDIENRIVRDNLTVGRVQRLERIELVVSDIVNNYGHLFNAHTAFPNVSDQQIVFFDIRNLTSLKREIFNVQMFNILSLFWGTMLEKGAPQKNKWDTSNHTIDEWMEIVRTILIIDEAHLLFNSGTVEILDYMISFLRETRKYFTALWYATQQLRDVVPESASAEFMDKLKTLFELTQYKFIMQQDSSSIPLARSIFKTTITDADYTAIPQFRQGECLLHDGVDCIRFLVDVNSEELSMFHGGA